MSRIKRGRPSPAILVAVMALVAALAGTALAGSGPSANMAGNLDKALTTAKKAKKKAKKADKNAKAAQGSADAAQGSADAAQGSADAAQGSADSANSKLACPGGTSLVDGSCIETSARTAATFGVAEAACLAAGRRLPSIAELVSATNSGIVSGPAEFTNLDYDDSTVSEVVVVIGGTVGLSTPAIVTLYRCVAPAG